MKRFHLRRLSRLADHLDTVQEEQFNLDYWKCSTTACACGHACDIPSFKRAGFHLVPSLNNDGFFSLKLKNHNLTGIYAAAVFFGITADTARRFFLSESYPKPNKTTPKEVASRIRKFVTQQEWLRQIRP